MEDPWDNETSRVGGTSETSVNAGEHDTARTTDAAEEHNDHGSHMASYYASMATPFHTPITNHHTPREHDESVYSTSQIESEPVEKVLVSYLLRHFKQGPGQW